MHINISKALNLKQTILEGDALKLLNNLDQKDMALQAMIPLKKITWKQDTPWDSWIPDQNNVLGYLGTFALILLVIGLCIFGIKRFNFFKRMCCIFQGKKQKADDANREILQPSPAHAMVSEEKSVIVPQMETQIPLRSLQPLQPLRPFDPNDTSPYIFAPEFNL